MKNNTLWRAGYFELGKRERVVLRKVLFLLEGLGITDKIQVIKILKTLKRAYIIDARKEVANENEKN